MASGEGTPKANDYGTMSAGTSVHVTDVPHAPAHRHAYCHPAEQMTQPRVRIGKALNKPGMSYDLVRREVRSFDLIMYHGGGGVSDCIACCERSRLGLHGDVYTHVGMVIRGSLFPVGHALFSQERIYVLEATQSGYVGCGLCVAGDGAPSLSIVQPRTCCHEGGEALSEFAGAQLRDLDSVVAAYDSNPASFIAWAPLLPPQRAIANSVTPAAWLAVFDKYNGSPYSLSALQLCAAIVPCLRPIRDSRVVALQRCAVYTCCGWCGVCKYGGATARRWLFCSELVSRVLVDLRIMTLGSGATGAAADHNPRDVVPADFLPATAVTTPDPAVPLIVSDPTRITMFQHPPILLMTVHKADGRK